MRRQVLAITSMLMISALATNTQAQFSDVLRKFTSKAKTTTKQRQIAYFKIKGQLTESPVEMPPLFGSDPPLSLKVLLDRFKEALHDDSVVAVVVDLQSAALGVGQLFEIHEALEKFDAVDKDVYVHADSLRTMTYAAATGASHISIVPTGDLWLTGIYSETPYLKGTLEKLGCIADIERCGDFKSAAETLTRSGPSEESQRMKAWLLDGIYDDLVELIADSRGFSTSKMRALIDQGPYTASAALDAGLIDAVEYRQDFIANLKKRHGRGVDVVMDYGQKDAFDMPKDPFSMIPWIMEKLNPSPKVYTTPSVAIVYVEGTIQTGSAEVSPFSSSSGAFSTDIRKALDKAAKDRSVKAVVLRVDSPGGSALASEIILNAARRVAKKKPLVVSMGNVAGSGGYYVSCAAETIFADPTTITGSIGVLGGKIITTGLWDKLGVTWHANQRGKMAGMLSTAAPFSESERRKMRSYLDEIYEVFKGHVVDARQGKLSMPIEEIAGGRVYTGRQAMELGLVDKMGGLEDSIKFAASEAGLSEYDIRVIPEAPNIFDLFLGSKKKDNEFSHLSGAVNLSLVNTPLIQSMLPAIAKIDPLRAKAVLQSLLGLELIHRESAVMIMPEQILIR